MKLSFNIKNKMYCIYAIINKINDKIYIGYTKDYKTRMRKHFSASNWERNPNKHLYNSMKFHGKENFYHLILEYCNSKELAKKTEIYFINFFKKLKLELYNKTKGGDGGGKLNQLNNENEKCCIKCKKIKPNSEFHKTKTNYWGYSYKCKDCAHIRSIQLRIDRNGTEEYLIKGTAVNNDTHKYCANCKSLKLHNKFYVLKNKKLSCYCKECEKEKSRVDKYKMIGFSINNENQKYCPQCKKTKFLTNEYFYKDKSSSSGFAGKCKECASVLNKQYRENKKLKQ